MQCNFRSLFFFTCIISNNFMEVFYQTFFLLFYNPGENRKGHGRVSSLKIERYA